MLEKQRNPFQVSDKGFKIRHSTNDSLGLKPGSSKSGMHFYIVLLESVASVLIVLLGSKKEKHKELLSKGYLLEINNTIPPKTINRRTGNRYGTVVQNEVKEISKIPSDHISYTDPKDNQEILIHLFDNQQHPEQSEQNLETAWAFKNKMKKEKRKEKKNRKKNRKKK